MRDRAHEASCPTNNEHEYYHCKICDTAVVQWVMAFGCCPECRERIMEGKQMMHTSPMGESEFDWKDVFRCPKCKEGRLDLKNEEQVCDKCGYREPFKMDYHKIPPIMDG